MNESDRAQAKSLLKAAEKCLSDLLTHDETDFLYIIQLCSVLKHYSEAFLRKEPEFFDYTVKITEYYNCLASLCSLYD